MDECRKATQNYKESATWGPTTEVGTTKLVLLINAETGRVLNPTMRSCWMILIFFNYSIEGFQLAKIRNCTMRNTESLKFLPESSEHSIQLTCWLPCGRSQCRCGSSHTPLPLPLHRTEKKKKMKSDSHLLLRMTVGRRNLSPHRGSRMRGQVQDSNPRRVECFNILIKPHDG